MIDKFPKVKTFYSFQKDTEDYKLFKVNKEIISRFHDLLDKLESQPQTILCTRGDSEFDIQQHEILFNDNLNKKFIVGAKAKFAFKRNIDVDNIYQHTDTENIIILQKDLKTLIQEANEAMNQREIESSLKVLKYFTSLKIDKYCIESLLKLKIFFLSFFHTDGKLRELSDVSPFLSMTYGSKKFTTARKFAFGKDKPKEKAFIYLYSLNAGDTYYMKTDSLSKKLNREGAKWHNDKYNEILLINGMFPHYLLGIFEIVKYKTPRFIINPYLYELLEENKSFDYINGLKINQDNFIEYASKLGYKRYFTVAKKGIKIVSMDGSSLEEVTIP